MTIQDYYSLPLSERWPAMREHWMKSLLNESHPDAETRDTIICAIRDLLDELHGAPPCDL